MERKEDWVALFWAPTCQSWALVCLHRPNPIMIHPFKPSGGKVCGKDIDVHCGGKSIVWDDDPDCSWQREDQSSEKRSELDGGVLGKGRDTWAQRSAHHCPWVSKWADWRSAKRSAVGWFCLPPSISNKYAGRQTCTMESTHLCQCVCAFACKSAAFYQSVVYRTVFDVPGPGHCDIWCQSGKLWANKGTYW